jgi:hypothetical protein
MIVLGQKQSEDRIMKLRRRLGRLEVRVGPPLEPEAELSPEEVEQRLGAWLGHETYNRGLFDADPDFRPGWSHYHRVWVVHTMGYSPLGAVWLAREPAEFEEARRRVVAVMVRVLEQQPGPLQHLAELLRGSLPEELAPRERVAGD